MENSSCTCFPFVKCKVDTECSFGCISVQYRDDCDLINSISIPLAVIAVLIICLCIVAIIRMRCACRDCNTSRPRTAANAESQMTNLSFDTFDEIKRTSNNLDLHVSFEVKSDIPPSYESVMSRSNEAIQATDSLPPSTSASNKDSSEDVDPPLSYASLIS
ncbi:uncharacterized protein LOC128163387 [Crassostrea angulata]|uniref:uncharacterized protein LOC128163387 n=1 Tax=Magallana angulata TaxID=2784310 RepID=UPI0022B087D6|nr:uncharacterized protein LOC128163387 [Crassostrea angulata]